MRLRYTLLLVLEEDNLKPIKRTFSDWIVTWFILSIVRLILGLINSSPLNTKGVFEFWKIERKEKNLESNFLSIVWFEKSQKKKIERKNARKIWVVMKKKFPFQIWEKNEGKICFKLLVKTTNRLI